MSDGPLTKTAADVQTIVDRSAYLSWLGLNIIDLGANSIEATAKWRAEWVANPDIGQTQGGILASLLDFAANFAMMNSMGGPVPTVDLRVDYHRFATKGDLTVKGRVIKFGRTFSSSEASVYDADGRLLASARGTFLTKQPTHDDKS